MNRLVQTYMVMTQQAEVSGFEHLEMLDIRDRIEQDKEILTNSDRKLLALADQQLLGQARLFLMAMDEIVDLREERLRHNPPAAHWWWYLDVLAQLPAFPLNGKQAHVVASSVLHA